jgi:putative hydrolase of the HAD superfamily
VGTTEGPPDSPRLLIFDVDGVLYRYDRDVRTRALAGAAGVTAEAMHEALFGSGIEDRADAGELSPEEYLEALSDRLGVRVKRDDWVAAWAEAATPDFAVLGLAARACRVAKVAALSNNGALLKAEAPRILPELVALVLDRLFVSGELRLAKPDPAAYWAVVDRCGVAVQDALFVDDSEANVEGARLAGLGAHHFSGPEGLADFLAANGLLPA